jgi:hypothetical protein
MPSFSGAFAINGWTMDVTSHEKPCNHKLIIWCVCHYRGKKKISCEKATPFSKKTLSYSYCPILRLDPLMSIIQYTLIV